MSIDELPKPLARKALFSPCKSKEELDRWIRLFLKIRLPDVVVSDESNSSPLDVLWQLYDRAVRNDTAGWRRSMTYASRFSGKTLSASILEVLLLLHTDRNIIHMAAIGDQSKKAQEYVKGFFSNHLFNEFVVGDNSKETLVIAYKHKLTGEWKSEAEYLDAPDKGNYTRKSNYIRIIMCTMQSSNGQHGEFFVIDEVDVIPKQHHKAYEQAKGGVPTARNGMAAMTLFTSTRKSRIGKVQQEIDKAEKLASKGEEGLRLNHWNIIDITEPCKKERYKADSLEDQNVPYYINDADVRHITEEEYNDLPITEHDKWYERKGFPGCKTCKLFPLCKGRLATHQTGTVGDFEAGGTALLLPIDEVVDKLTDATPEFITTEYAVRKPDTSGLVYPRYDEKVHRLSAQEIAEKVSGVPQPEIDTKMKLLRFLAEQGVPFATGMDFGYTHLFTAVTAAIHGNIAFVVDAVGLAKQELDDKMALTKHLKASNEDGVALNSSIYADPEDPGAVASFKNRGWKMKEWSKNSGSVKAGIEIARTKLYSKANGPTVFFLKDDADIDLLCQNIRDYHYTTGPDGNFTEEPDEEGDDYPDAWRYLMMNVFGKNGGLKRPNLGLAPVQKAALDDWTAKAKLFNSNVLKNKISSLTGKQEKILDEKGVRVRKGGFLADL